MQNSEIKELKLRLREKEDEVLEKSRALEEVMRKENEDGKQRKRAEDEKGDEEAMQLRAQLRKKDLELEMVKKDRFTKINQQRREERLMLTVMYEMGLDMLEMQRSI